MSHWYLGFHAAHRTKVQPHTDAADSFKLKKKKTERAFAKKKKSDLDLNLFFKITFVYLLPAKKKKFKN